MAALAVARVSGVADTVWGNKRVRVRKITGPSSYTTGGEAFTPAQVNLQQIGGVMGFTLRKTSDDSAAIFGSYNRTSGKLVFYWGNAGTAGVAPEVTSTTDLSGYAGEVTFFGTGSA